MLGREIREKLVLIFKDTENLCKKNSILRKSILKSRKLNKTYYNRFEIDKLVKSEDYNIVFEEKRTLDCAKKLKGKTAVLNFANAHCPGGGVWGGYGTQEESICRCSTLYDVIDGNEFYTKDIDLKCIYSKDIIVFKTDEYEPKLLREQDWYKVDVITAAAPNVSFKEINKKELIKIFYDKIMLFLDICMYNNVDNIILGAWGCGAFGNDPILVSLVFRYCLVKKEYYKYFKKVIFSIPKDSKNYETFYNILS